MKKVVLAILLLLVLALGGFGAYVANMDWNQYKAEIANQISELTGKKVVLQGNISMSILPAPTLSAENVLLYNQEGDYSTKPLAEIKKVEAKVSIGVLFSNSFDVQRIALKEPKLVFEIDKQRRLNWLGRKKKGTAREDVDISLDSVTFEKATVRFIEQSSGIDTEVENLNAEVIAQTVTGPYRIEGSYTKGDQPEGFAVSLGKVVEGMATSVNFVVNYPSTKSYVRFDGTVFLENSNVLGSMVVESEQPANWVNGLQDEFMVEQEYNQPLALSADINTNATKIDLSNVVLKYGKTSGAGNVLIPLLTPEMREQQLRPKVEMAFDMTDLDLEPAAIWIKKWIDEHRAGASYQPNSKFDVIGDIKAIKTYYRGETLREMSLSFDWVDNSLLIREMKAALLKDSSISIKGNWAEKNRQPQYSAEVQFMTGELDKLSAWAGVKLTQFAPATYQKATGKANLTGNLMQLQVSPYELALDKSIFKGDAGFVLSNPMKSFIVMNVDSINFDNYLPPLSNKDSQNSFFRRIMARLQNYPVLRNLDMRLQMKADLVILENLPFENIDMSLMMDNGQLQLERFEAENVANAKVALNGVLRGVGEQPVVDVLDYSLSTQNFGAMCNKLEVALPDANWQALKRFTANGKLFGDSKQFNLSTDVALENMTMQYQGMIDMLSEKTRFDGEIILKAPDFVKMLNNFNVKYAPKAFSLGLFSASGNIVGVWDNFRLRNAIIDIGSNKFSGEMAWDRTNGRNSFVTQAKINKFEFDQFISDASVDNRISFQDGGRKAVDFLQKPFWSKDKIDYSFISSFDLVGNFDVDSMSWKGHKFDKAKFALSLVNGKLEIKDFKADYNGGTAEANVLLQASALSTINGNIKLEKQPVRKNMWVGKKYGLEDGMANWNIQWNTSAVSEESFIQSLQANVRFEIFNPVVKGWDLKAIKDDLFKRSESAGIHEKVQSLLQSGRTSFDSLTGTLLINKDRYDLQEVVFAAGEYSVKMTAEGSIPAWDIKANFDEMWGDAKTTIPDYDFELSGSLENPQLRVDVSKIQNMLDEINAKKEAEQKAREQARLNNLKQMMATQQSRAVLLRRKLNEEILPLYQKRVSVLEDEQAKKDLAQIDESISSQLKVLDEVNTLAMTPEFDETLVAKLRQYNDGVEKVSAGYEVEIESLYKGGLKREVEKLGMGLVDESQKIQAEYDKKEQEFKSFYERLDKIGSVLDLKKTATIVNLRVAADTNMNNVKEMRKGVEEGLKNINQKTDVANLETLKQNWRDKQSAMQEAGANLDMAVESLFKEAEKLVKAEEEWFSAKQQTEARQKKVAESISTISVDATGKTTTFVPDIEDLEKAEKEVAEENIPVLDFSGKVRRDDEPVLIKEKTTNSGWITKSDGSTIDAGGTIRRD